MIIQSFYASLAEYIIKWLAHRLPDRRQEREDEWLGTLDSIDDAVKKLHFSISLFPFVFRHTACWFYLAEKINQFVAILIGLLFFSCYLLFYFFTTPNPLYFIEPYNHFQPNATQNNDIWFFLRLWLLFMTLSIMNHRMLEFGQLWHPKGKTTRFLTIWFTISFIIVVILNLTSLMLFKNHIGSTILLISYPLVLWFGLGYILKKEIQTNEYFQIQKQEK